MKLDYLALYSENCLKCKHLCPSAPQTFDECHYEKHGDVGGNKQCPAKDVRLEVTGEALEYARKVLRARDKRLPKAEARLMKYVGAKSPAFQSRFYEFLENGGRLIK